MPLFKSAPSDKSTSLTLSDEQKLNWLRLIRSHNVGPATFWRMINYFGGAEQALEHLPEFQRRSRKHKSHHPPITLPMVERELKAARKFGATLKDSRGEHGYPPILAHLDVPPPLLYIKGDANLTTLPAVAIVGSRNGSAVGQKFTRRLVQDLAQAGYAIVSGLARGIDTAAHTGARRNRQRWLLSRVVSIIITHRKTRNYKVRLKKPALLSPKIHQALSPAPATFRAATVLFPVVPLGHCRRG